MPITPEMIGKYLQDIKGNCEITKVAVWLPESQEWDSKSGFLNLYFNNKNLEWRGVVIKVSNDCKLGESISAPQVPQLPQ